MRVMRRYDEYERAMEVLDHEKRRVTGRETARANG
jgi:hypothetical protein